MSAATLEAGAFPERGGALAPWRVIARIAQAVRAMLRVVVLAGLYPLALADAAWLRIVTTPNGSALAHARAAWLHRWSRIARRVLGLRLDQRGFTPVSGIVVANYTSLLDAIVLAAVRPCVFVAGAEVRRWPVVGLLARLGGVLFVDPRRRNDAARISFMIQRAVQRRLLVVVFPKCGGTGGAVLRTFASALFQPAAELGCTLTAAAIDYRAERGRPAPIFPREARAVIAFSAPAFRRGGRKQLARQLHEEVLEQKLRAGCAAR